MHDRRIRERVEEGKAFLVRWFAESRIRSDRCAGVREAEGVAGLRRARRKRLHFVDGFADELVCGILLPSLMFLHAALQKFRGPASGTAPVCVVSRHVRPPFASSLALQDETESADSTEHPQESNAHTSTHRHPGHISRATGHKRQGGLR